MEMHSLTFKTEDWDKPSNKNGKHPMKDDHPELCIRQNVPDALYDCDVGQEIRCEVIFKVTNKRLDENQKKSTRGMHLAAMSIGIIKKGKGKTLKEYEKMSKEDREAYDKESVGLRDEY